MWHEVLHDALEPCSSGASKALNSGEAFKCSGGSGGSRGLAFIKQRASTCHNGVKINHILSRSEALVDRMKLIVGRERTI